jgi:hypothetical protein
MKSPAASFFGNALASAINFLDASFACVAFSRPAASSSFPIPLGHGRAAEVATAPGTLNQEMTHTTSAIAAMTISAFFIVARD